jgi:molybdenum cofactor cytidylyltransferase
VTLAGIVLAAGSASRFGSDKLSARFRGEPLLAHAIRAARAAPVARVIVVCPPALAIGAWQGVPPVIAARIASSALSTSLKAGIAAAGDVDGVFVFLGDMPLIPHDLAGRLAEALGDRFASVPRNGGKNGHPVLLSRRAFAEIAGLGGDEGAGKLLKARGDIAFVDCPAATIHLDVDRAEDLDRLERWRGESR